MQQPIRIVTWLIILSLVFINPIFWAFSLYADYERPLFNIDYFVVLLLLFFVYRKSKYYLIPLSILASLLVVIDLIATVSTVYFFISIHDLLGLVQYTDQANIWYMIAPLFLVIMTVFFLLIIKLLLHKLFLKQISKEGLYLFGSIWFFFMVVGDFEFKDIRYETIKKSIIEETQRDTKGRVFRLSNNYFGSQVKYLYENMNTSFRQAVELGVDNANELVSENINVNRISEIEGLPRTQGVATDNIRESSRVLLIVVESFGLTVNPDNMLIVYPQLKKLTEIAKNVQFGSVYFDGGTVVGEVREICRLSLKGPSPLFLAHYEQCIPNKLKAKGYKTYSINSWSKGMYAADVWYAKAGIDHRFFLENLSNLGRSYGYPAGKDINVLPKIVEALNNEPEKVFIYHLPGNSHFPYDERDAIGSNYVCPADFNSELCNFARIHDIYFSALHSVLKDLTNLKVIIVGDHAPPFRKNLNRDYFNSSFVPSMVLEF